MPTSQFDILTQKAPRRREWSEEPRKFPVLIGVVSTLLFHLLLWFVVPLVPLGDSSHWKPKPNDSTKGKTFDFILERLPEAQPEPDKFRYVVTNADAPANEPDKTINISNRNQQSAQEEAAKEIDPDNNPSVKGREDIDPTNAIVSGQMTQPQEAVPVEPQHQPADQPAQQVRAPQVPLPGTDKIQGDAPGGVGMDNSPSDLPTNHADQFQEGNQESRSPTGALQKVPESTRPQPRPRPKLNPANPNVLGNKVSGTRNAGLIAIDARWNPYGDYLAELEGIVVAQWYGVLAQSSVRPTNMKVTIKFRLNSEGQIKIVSVEGPVGNFGTYAALNAIEEPAPYRKWDAAMIAMLGTEQEMVFSFWYQ